MKKGISAIIATILLLLIVIAIVGFTFGFFQNLFTTSSNAANSQLQQTTGQLSKSVSIDNIQTGPPATVTVLNSGTGTITAATELVVYIAGASQTCSWSAPTIAPSTRSTCTMAGVTCSSGTVVKVGAPAGQVTATC